MVSSCTQRRWRRGPTDAPRVRGCAPAAGALLAAALLEPGCASTPAPETPLPRGEAVVVELAPRAWCDGRSDADGHDAMKLSPSAVTELRFRLPRRVMRGPPPARAYLRLYATSLDVPADARLSVARFDAALAGLPRPPPAPPASIVTLARNPVRVPLTNAVHDARAAGGDLMLKLQALDAQVRLSSPQALDPAHQPRLELWWPRTP